MINELCMKSFNCFGCQSGACVQFHPADPRATYAIIAAFAARAERDGFYVDPLTTTWTVCEVPVHVHAERHVGPLDTRLCYDVLASRAERRQIGKRRAAILQSHRPNARIEADNWLLGASASVTDAKQLAALRGEAERRTKARTAELAADEIRTLVREGAATELRFQRVIAPLASTSPLGPSTATSSTQTDAPANSQGWLWTGLAVAAMATIAVIVLVRRR